MTASIWEPGSTPALNSDASTKTQRFVAVADQIIFNLTEFTYTVGIDNLLVYKNGLALAPGVDFFESTASSFTLAVAADLDDEILALGFVGVTGEVPVSILTQEDVISSAAALRAYGGTLDLIFLKGTATPLDGGEGMFQFFSGQAPGTYVDNNLDTIVPAGGDGSAAWRRQTPAMLRSQLELNTVSQAEAEAAVATTTRAWTAERVGQAIISGINNIVTGGYIASLYEALTNTNKYTDAEKATLAALPVPPAAINSFYRRAGNMQLYAGGYDGIVTKYFLLNGIPFLDAWATVGPTGSGADKIHEPLDELPDETAAVLLEMDSTITSNGSAGAIIGRIWAAAGDVLTPTIDGNSFAPFVHKVQVAATSESHGIATQIWVPVEKGTKIWKFYFTKSGPISGFSVQCKLVGFMTD